ncbi:flagellar hook assembly protein FlgD [Coralloluteibacterium thermophilus]|uniref:Basal-body rod modification protein FlgD n=1 Tax=Coralloluteibacterium thermophilum TaxID=2707049 RepID=A0ABV9NPW8_9GAMM
MTTVDTSNPYASLGLGAPPNAGNSKSMGQADFLRLLTEQLRNQDPLNPVSNQDFVAQMAQFAQVQGTQEMQVALGAMASVMESDQALRAASLVGHEALVDGSTVTTPARPDIAGELTATGAGPITIDIADGTGRLVRRLNIEATGAGQVPFAWDGLGDDGQPAGAGTYTITATQGSGDAATMLAPTLSAKVESVSITSQGLSLNLAGIGAVKLAAVRKIG